MFTLFFAIPGVVSPLLLLLVTQPKHRFHQAQRVRSMTEEEREDLLEGLKAKWEQVRDPGQVSEGKVGVDFPSWN